MSRLTRAALALVLASGAARAQVAGLTVRPGDRVWLMVEGEAALSDTFTVTPELGLVLPVIGELSLAGVRRADIERHLQRELGRYFRDPLVRARTLVRIAIAGQVQRPGFYAVPADITLPDVVMLAGGATPEAALERMRIERRQDRLVEPARVAAAVAHGLTIDDLGLEAGDRIVVPGRGRTVERLLPMLLAVPAAIYALSQLF